MAMPVDRHAGYLAEEPLVRKRFRPVRIDPELGRVSIPSLIIFLAILGRGIMPTEHHEKDQWHPSKQPSHCSLFVFKAEREDGLPLSPSLTAMLNGSPCQGFFQAVN